MRQPALGGRIGRRGTCLFHMHNGRSRSGFRLRDRRREKVSNSGPVLRFDVAESLQPSLDRWACIAALVEYHPQRSGDHGSEYRLRDLCAGASGLLIERNPVYGSANLNCRHRSTFFACCRAAPTHRTLYCIRRHGDRGDRAGRGGVREGVDAVIRMQERV